MFISSTNIGRIGLLCAVAFAGAACSRRAATPPTVAELMSDRVMLDGLVMKCGDDLRRVRTRPDCAAARIAIDRLAEQTDAAEAARREAQFERRREELRLAEEQHRLEVEAREKVDAYTLPLVPIGPNDTQRTAQSGVADTAATPQQ